MENGEFKEVVEVKSEETKIVKPITSSPKEKIYISKVVVVYNGVTGETISVRDRALPSLSNVTQEALKDIKTHEIVFEWTKPNYKDQSYYRESVQEWKSESELSATNIIRLRQLYLDYHLQKVIGLFDSKGDEIVLKHEMDGDRRILTEESHNKLMQVDSVIMDAALILFERDILIVKQ